MSRVLVVGNSEIKKRMEIENRLKSEYEVHIITPENYTENSFLNIFQMGSMFSNKKMVIIKNFHKFKDKDREIIAENIMNKNAPVEELIITSDEEKELKSMKKKFDENIVAELPAPWEKDNWRKFVREVLNQFNKKMNDNTIDYLLEILGHNDLFIYEEIQKLSIYTEEELITVKDVREIVTHFSKPEFEDIAYMICLQKEDKAIEMINELMSDPQFIPTKFIGFLTNYFYDLYKTMNVITGTRKYTWPNVKKISKEIKVSSPRVRSFCGVSFSNDKIKKLNIAGLLTRKNVAKIIFNIEKLEREVKSVENTKTPFIKFVINSMFHKNNP
jgi:DNA polymerase-3 subunit delta